MSNIMSIRRDDLRFNPAHGATGYVNSAEITFVRSTNPMYGLSGFNMMLLFDFCLTMN